jgi:hypothetical protein
LNLKRGFLALPAKPEDNRQGRNSQAAGREDFCYNLNIIFK